YYVTPEGYGQWCFDEPLDLVDKWDISLEEAGEEGNKYQVCRVVIKGQRKDESGNMDEVSFEQRSAGGADLAKIKEGGKWRVYHVTATGKKSNDIIEGDKPLFYKINKSGVGIIVVKKENKINIWGVSPDGAKEGLGTEIDETLLEIVWAGFNSEEDYFTMYYNTGKGLYFRKKLRINFQKGEIETAQKPVFQLQALEEIIPAGMTDKKEAVLADGRKALLLKVEQDSGKWNFYYITPEGNGRWCLDKPLDNVEDWYISAREAGEKGDKYQICSVTIEGQRKDKTGNMDEVSLELISAGGADLARIKERGEWRVYHVTTHGEINDVTGLVGRVPDWVIGGNGACFVEVREGDKYRVYHVTMQGASNDITGKVDLAFLNWKMGADGAGFVIVKDDKIKIYFVSSEGKKETVAENADEILWTGF
ncbi:MAG: hypothetical protein KAJ14_11010, partial [Candidatus Omnitrophica bacterium]|nr:hypothetical protein [Candidatus Omnitrophota bacterium]